MAALTLRTAAGFAFALVVLAAPAAAGEIYQWKDANGVTHYSDSPPPHNAYRNRTIRTGSAAPVADAAPQKPAEHPNCTNARLNLERLAGDAPVGFDNDGDGKMDGILTAEQRAAQKELMQAAVKAHCAPTTASAQQK